VSDPPLILTSDRILHSGYMDYEGHDARRVHDIASMGLELLKRMDRARQGGAQAVDPQ